MSEADVGTRRLARSVNARNRMKKLNTDIHLHLTRNSDLEWKGARETDQVVH